MRFVDNVDNVIISFRSKWCWCETIVIGTGAWIKLLIFCHVWISTSLRSLVWVSFISEKDVEKPEIKQCISMIQRVMNRPKSLKHKWLSDGFLYAGMLDSADICDMNSAKTDNTLSKKTVKATADYGWRVHVLVCDVILLLHEQIPENHPLYIFIFPAFSFHGSRNTAGKCGTKTRSHWFLSVG